MKSNDVLHAKSNTASKVIRFPGKGESYSVKADNIISLEAESNYTYIYTDAGKPFLMAKVLKEYERILKPFDFIRINRSTLVNKNRIAGLNESGGIVMDDQRHFTISRRKKSSIRLALC